MVCPMRVVLVVVSAFIAGYLTWKTWESTSDILSADAAGSRRLRSEDPKKTVRLLHFLLYLHFFSLLPCWSFRRQGACRPHAQSPEAKRAPTLSASSSRSFTAGSSHLLGRFLCADASPLGGASLPVAPCSHIAVFSAFLCSLITGSFLPMGSNKVILRHALRHGLGEVPVQGLAH